MPHIKSFLVSHKRVLLLLSFFMFFLLFMYAGQLQSKAKDLGFGPALIDTGNCIIGSAPCNPSSAQEIHLFQPSANSTSALAATGQLMDTMYTNPASSSVIWAFDQYHKVRNQELLMVYAQQGGPSETSFYFPGLGYNLLQPMLGLWQWSRNTVYMFYIVIIIFLAGLILFRQTLSGQAAISIINSLPSLILSLVLVTLSYPIAGFFVDLIYIGSNVAQGLLITSEGVPGYDLVGNKFLTLDNNDVYYLQPDDPEISLWAIWGTAKTEIYDCSQPDTPCISNLLPKVEAGYLQFIGRVLPVVEEGADGLLGRVSDSGLLNLILGLTALMASFRLFLTLLKNYVLLTLSPLYLPWMFLLAAIPSKTKTSVLNAIKPLAAASLSFIAVYILFLLMIIIGRSGDFSSSALRSAGEFRFAPPLLGYDSGEIIGGSAQITRTLIIYILFLASPTIPDMVNNLLNVQSSSQVASQVGQNAATGFGTLFGGMRGMVRRANRPGQKKQS